ncbi:hypothetical protein [Aeromonas sp. FDAARGOS 1408]|uniref:hypothetical protein n=1 Tax=Aeromonas TaxID=642 RepID=UPI001C23A7ED|nr:hypothetical protein [Aeromonas sp. FDAARGOS 1408]QXC10438.1 hypothetical protein I6L38_11040 [Aeromonas sp. FDAARGOS 1408]
MRTSAPPLKRVSFEDASETHFKSGGGDNGGGGMESRVAKLESDVEFIKRDITELKGSVRSIETTVQDIRVLLEGMKTNQLTALEKLSKLDEKFATKVDLEARFNKMYLWLFGAVFTGCGLLFTLLRFFPAGK